MSELLRIQSGFKGHRKQELRKVKFVAQLPCPIVRKNNGIKLVRTHISVMCRA